MFGAGDALLLLWSARLWCVGGSTYPACDQEISRPQKLSQLPSLPFTSWFPKFRDSIQTKLFFSTTAHQSNGRARARRPPTTLSLGGLASSSPPPAASRPSSSGASADVRAVATGSSLHFIDRASFPSGVGLLTDDDEWSAWRKIGDEALHIELRKWADAMVIAPLSANTLAKIVGGLCDNLLTCAVRAWDYSKPVYVAPAMNTFMRDNPFTRRHLGVVSELGMPVIPPVTKRLACGD